MMSKRDSRSTIAPKPAVVAPARGRARHNLVYSIGGLFHLAVALSHLSFWSLFGLNQELARMRPLNRGVLQVLNLRITYLFLAFAVLSWLWPENSCARVSVSGSASFSPASRGCEALSSSCSSVRSTGG